MEPAHFFTNNPNPNYGYERVSVVQCDSSSGNSFQPISEPPVGFPVSSLPRYPEAASNSITTSNRCRNQQLKAKPKASKFKVRRHKANARERNRMHGLNAALDRLRKSIPIHSRYQKLSKIETLRLARNYIEGMTEILQEDSPLEITKFAKTLARGMSQGTTTAIAGFLNLNPKTVFPAGAGQCEGLEKSQAEVFEPAGILPEYRIPNSSSSSPGFQHFGAHNADPYQQQSACGSNENVYQECSTSGSVRRESNVEDWNWNQEVSNGTWVH